MKTMLLSFLLLLTGFLARAQSIDTLRGSDSSAWQPVALAYDLAHALPRPVAGLTVVRPGSDPNALWQWRVRGLSSLDQRTQPTFIGGGLTEVPSWAVPAWAVDSVAVAASGFARARYGIRGGAGLVAWYLPRPADQGRRRVLELTGGLSAVSRYHSVADAATYRTLEGATDYGSATDWQRLVSRRGSHMQYRFLLSETWQGGGIFLTGGWTALEGVVRQTGFRQEQGAAVVEQALFAERLKLTAEMVATHRSARLGFAETVRYAAIANPTAPVRSDDPQYEPFGGYHQPVLFDYFNPVAMVELDRHQGQYFWVQGSLRAEWQLTPWLSARGSLGGALMAVQEDEWYHPQSLFRSWLGEGITRVFIDRTERSQWRGEAGLEARGALLGMPQRLSLQWWHEQLDPQHLMVGGFQQLERYLGTTPIATLRAAPEEKDELWTRYRHELTGFGLDYGLQPVPRLALDALLRYDGSSWLGAEARFGWYHGLRARYDLSGKVAAGALSQLNVEAEWGQSGGLPTRGGMSQWQWLEGGWVWYNGGFIPMVQSWYAPNAALQAERTRMFDLRLSAKSTSGRLSGSLAWFIGASDRLIEDAWVAHEHLVADRQWRNTAALSQQGWELELAARLIDRADRGWSQRLQLWSVQQRVEDLYEPFQYVAPPGAPGSCCGYMVKVAPGLPVGQFIGPEYEGVDADGNPVYRDLDGDGIVELGDPETDDTRPLGTGWPRLQLGWQHELRFRKWHLQARLRAALGHRMAHMMRFFYESAEPGRVALWNRITTRYFNRRQRGFPVFSDFYLENASFLELDALRLGRTFQLGALTFDLTLALENALLWSPYTGLDPQLRLFDAGTSSNAADPWAPLPALAPGIDRRNAYFRAHTFVLGLRWRW